MNRQMPIDGDMIALQNKYPKLMVELGAILEKSASESSINQQLTSIKDVVSIIGDVIDSDISVPQKAALEIAAKTLESIFVLKDDKAFPLFDTQNVKADLPKQGAYDYVYLSDDGDLTVVMTETDCGVYFDCTKPELFDAGISAGFCGVFEGSSNGDTLASMSIGRDQNGADFQLTSYANGRVSFEDISLTCELPEFTDILAADSEFLSDLQEQVAEKTFAADFPNQTAYSIISQDNATTFSHPLNGEEFMTIKFRQNSCLISSKQLS